jgi:hypothetical protein
MKYNQLFLHEVLAGIQPDVITELQGRLASPFVANIQIRAEKSALTILNRDTYAVVCVQQPGRSEQDFLYVQYQKNPDDTYSVLGVYYLTPEEVVRLRRRGIVPLES